MDEYRYKTSVNVLLGPFVDKSNAFSAETGLTPSVGISKAGANFAARASTRSVTHHQQGWYKVPANSVDIGTLGRITFMAAAPNTHLAVWKEGMVLRSAAWDSKYLHPGGSALVSAAVKKALSDQGLDAWSAGASAAVRNNVVNYHLDHLLHTSAPLGVPAPDTVVVKIMQSGAALTFDRTTHSLVALRHKAEANGVLITQRATPANVESARAQLAAYHPTSAQVSAAVNRALVNQSLDSLSVAVSGRVANVIQVYDLDHLLRTSAPAGVPRSNTVMERIMVSAAAGTFDRTEHSLKAIRQHGDAGNYAGSLTSAALSGTVKHALTDIRLERLIALSATVASHVRSNSLLNRIMVSGATNIYSQAKGNLRSIWNRAGAVVSGAVTAANISAIADRTWQRLRSTSGVAPSGSFGEAINIFFGSGRKAVNHNTGGTDALRLLNSLGAAVSDARVRIYRKTDYDSGLVSMQYIKDQSRTNDNGRWVAPVYLDSGTVYTVVFEKPSEIATTRMEVTP